MLGLFLLWLGHTAGKQHEPGKVETEIIRSTEYWLGRFAPLWLLASIVFLIVMALTR